MPSRGRHRNPPLTPELRASDDDREQVVELLRDHYRAGRLSADELAERIENAYGARTQSDLSAQTVDLAPRHGAPAAQRARRGSAITPGGRGLRTSFRIHLAVYLVVNVALVCIWAVTGAGYFWPIWPLLG